jgi:hypothetical protein
MKMLLLNVDRKVDFSEVSSGIYFMQIEGKNVKRILKIIKE